MNCTIDIIKEGNYCLAYLPFNPRTEFGILKGTIFVKCIINKKEFKSKLMSKGNQTFFLMFNKQLIKNLGLSGTEDLNIELDITLDNTNSSEVAKTELLGNDTLKAIRERSSIRMFNGKEISAIILNTILEAGLCAPSATNKRPFHFVVTQDREKMLLR